LRASVRSASWLRCAVLRVSAVSAVSGAASFARTASRGGARLGGQVAGDGAHAVGVLAADGDAAPTRPVVLAEITVGVQAVGEFIGQLAEFVGAMLAGQAGQMCFGFLAGLDIDEIRQPAEEAADHRHMPEPDDPVTLRLCGGGQHRL